MATNNDENEQTTNESPIIAERRMYDALLSKVYGGDKEQLQNDIAEKRQAGALNDLSALRKLTRDKGRRVLPETVDLSGWFLQSYERQEDRQGNARGWSIYLATKNGIVTIHCGDPRVDLPKPSEKGISMKRFGNQQKWTGLQQVENVLYGTTSLSVVKGKTSFAPATDADLGGRLWKDVAAPLLRQDGALNITDGQSLWRAYIAAIFAVGKFENGKNVGNEPLIDTGGRANLRIGLIDSVDNRTGRVAQAKTFVQLTSIEQLRTLLGSYYDENFLLSDQAVTEMQQSFTGQPVLVFGSGRTPNSPTLTATQRKYMKEPKIQMFGGHGVVAPWVPEKDASNSD
ncbi:MAG: hypothetical protein ACYDG3_12755 [Bacillati bacterium]